MKTIAALCLTLLTSACSSPCRTSCMRRYDQAIAECQSFAERQCHGNTCTPSNAGMRDLGFKYDRQDFLDNCEITNLNLRAQCLATCP